METIDISLGKAPKISLQTWAEVAEHLGTTPKTIWRDRVALNRHEEPINPNLIEELRLMRLWCGRGGSASSRRRFVYHRLNGSLEEVMQTQEGDM